MDRKTYSLICTVLGFLGGVVMLGYTSARAGETLATWMNSLFVEKLWDSWFILILGVGIPTWAGFCVGKDSRGVLDLLLCPFAAALMGFLSLMAYALVCVIIDRIEIYGPLAMMLVVAAMVPATAKVTHIIIVRE